jgi:AraC-like DNA-binding protein
MIGSIAPGVDFLRIRNATALYRGMKAHYGVSRTFEGRTVTNVDGREGVQVPGTLQLKEPGQVHRDLWRGSPGTFQLVSFDARLIESAAMALGLGARPRLAAVQIAPGDAREGAFRRLHDLASRENADSFAVDTVVAEAVAAFASYLVAGSSPRAASDGERDASAPRLRASVQRARAFLLEHLAEAITLDALADHARADKFHLCRAFTAETGLPPYAFLTHARIAEARVLLRRGVRPSELAPLIGFCDQSQMHRHFVRIVGCTPGEYARA